MTTAGTVGSYRPGTPMRACRWNGPGQPLRLARISTPEPREPGDVVVRMERAMFGAALTRAVEVGHPRLVPPATLGTLFSGEVVAVAADAGGLRPGDRVVLDPHRPCGSCPDCRTGRARLCGQGVRLVPGALAEYVCVRSRAGQALRRIPAELPQDAALLTEPLACALAAVRDGAVRPDDQVLVIGSGQMAFLIAQAARRARPASVTCMVNSPSGRRLMRTAGIPTTDAPGPAPAPDGSQLPLYSVVFEAVGRPESYRTALASAAPAGTVVAFGGCAPGTRIDLDINALHYSCVRLVGSYHYPPGDFERALRLLADGDVDVTPLLGHELPLKHLAAAPRTAPAPDIPTLLIHP